MIKFFARLLNRLERKNKAYISDSDHFIQQFDEDHPRRSQSQLDEIAKHRNIFYRKTASKIRW